MKYTLILSLAMLLALQAVSTGAEKKDSLDGAWIAASAEMAGEPFPEQIRKNIKLVIDGEKYTVTIGPQIDKGTVKTDPSAKPKSIDITGGEGPNKGKTILAIYEHDGDTLKVCYDLSGKARPTEFKTAAGGQLFLVAYQRENSLTTRPTTAPAGAKAQPWKVIGGEEFALAVPAAWTPFDPLPPNHVALYNGDGKGIPMMDETGSPLQVGLLVEKFPKKDESLDEAMKSLIAAGKRNPRLVLEGKESVEQLKLSDGTEAALLSMQFIKEGRRRSLQTKLLVKDKAGQSWVVTGYIVGSKESMLLTPKSPLSQWLRAHMSTFCLSPAKFDQSKLSDAYADFQKNVKG